MNPALQAAIHSSAKHHKPILTQVQAANALSRETAVEPTQFGSEHKPMIDYYVKRGILKSTSSGSIYLDRRAYENHQARMKMIGIWFGMIFGFSCVIGVLLLLANKL